MKRAKLNYWIDVSIGISFVLSAISGLVFLLPVGSGSGILGLGYSLWSQLHTWSSLAMIVGVLAHLVLHWKWLVAMSKKTLLPAGDPRPATIAACDTEVTQRGMTRRQFLGFGLAAALTCAIATGYLMLSGSRTAGAEQREGDPADYPEASEAGLSQDESGQALQQQDVAPPIEEAEQPVQQGGVACLRGLVNDPYPGRCRRYTDSNGDGICDYSVPGSGNN